MAPSQHKYYTLVVGPVLIPDTRLGQGDLAIFVMGGSGRVEIMVKINYSDTAGQYKEGKSGESVKYGSE